MSVLTQIIYEFMNKYTDPVSASSAMNKYRQIAVDHTRSHDLAPMTYMDVIKAEEK